MHRASDGYRLLLAARKTAHQLVRTIDPLDRHNRPQNMGSSFAHLSLMHETKRPYHLSPHEDVARDRHRVDERRVLVDRLDAQLGRICVSLELHRFALPEKRAGVWLYDTRNRLDRSRLPGSVVAQECQDLRFPYVE